MYVHSPAFIECQRLEYSRRASPPSNLRSDDAAELKDRGLLELQMLSRLRRSTHHSRTAKNQRYPTSVAVQPPNQPAYIGIAPPAPSFGSGAHRGPITDTHAFTETTQPIAAASYTVDTPAMVRNDSPRLGCSSATTAGARAKVQFNAKGIRVNKKRYRFVHWSGYALSRYNRA